MRWAGRVRRRGRSFFAIIRGFAERRSKDHLGTDENADQEPSIESATPNADRPTEPSPDKTLSLDGRPSRTRKSRLPEIITIAAVAVLSAVVGGAIVVTAENFIPIRAHRAMSVEQVAAKVLPSVVMLQMTVVHQDTTRGFDVRSEQGSGIIVNSDGLILTSNHVLTNSEVVGAAGQRENLVTLNDGRKAQFTVVGSDPILDIAVVRIHGVSGLTPISFGSSANLDVGQQVVAIGSPQGFQSTVSAGIISALHRPIFEEGSLYQAIQIDAATSHGNSGGALVNLRGELIGVNSSGNEGAYGLSFAIPVDQAKRVADELIATGHATHGFLGLRATSNSDITNISNADGAKITAVNSNGAAAGARLAAGFVVTKLDDQPIANAGALAAAVHSKAPGAGITLTVLDPSGSTKTVQITLRTDQGIQLPSPESLEIAA
jgi:putative serine protease PepD